MELNSQKYTSIERLVDNINDQKDRELAEKIKNIEETKGLLKETQLLMEAQSRRIEEDLASVESGELPKSVLSSLKRVVDENIGFIDQIKSFIERLEITALEIELQMQI